VIPGAVAPERFSMRHQYTIRDAISFKGVGLHTGNEVTITFKPAEADQGITFVRTDLCEKPRIPALVENVIGVIRGTSLGIGGGVKVHTVEHVLSALSGLGIDNVMVEMDSSEPPAADGSSLPFVRLLDSVGRLRQVPRRKLIRLENPVMVSEENSTEAYEKHIMLYPSDTFKVSFTIVYPQRTIGTQFVEFEITENSFRKNIMDARTFGFLKEKEHLQAMGLALGASLDSCVILDENEILNRDIRYPDEFVRHKVLDVMGDFSLLGAGLLAHVVCIRSGHSLNVEAIRKVKKLVESGAGASFVNPMQDVSRPSLYSIRKGVKTC
jgi:UDP-3-O-acyl N-acetylglucosamine deacetylase